MKAENWLVLGAACLGGYLIYKGVTKGAAGVKKVITENLNPTSDQNLAYRAASAVVQGLTGDKTATLGTKIYDWLHPDQNIVKADFTKEIAVDNGNGWRYYTDGTAIAPNGDYYNKGKLVWSALGPDATAEQLAMHAAINQIPL